MCGGGRTPDGAPRAPAVHPVVGGRDAGGAYAEAVTARQALTAAGVAVLAVGLGGCSGSSRRSDRIGTVPAGHQITTTILASTSTVADPTAPREPSAFVAVTWSGGPSGLVVADRASGRTIRTLVPAEPGGGVVEASVSGDGSTVYFAAGFGTCAAGIGRVQVAAGGPEIVLPRATGIDGSPSVRPDGRMLAFASSDCSAHLSLVIAPTSTFAPASALVGQSPASTQAWSRDGSQLLTISNPPDGAPLLHVLSVTRSGTIGVDRIVASTFGCYYATALFSPDGSVVASRFCGANNDILSLDPISSRIRSVLVAAQPGRAALPQSLDTSGTYLLWNGGVAQGELSPSTSAWQVLAGGSTTALPHYATLVPVAWIG